MAMLAVATDACTYTYTRLRNFTIVYGGSDEIHC